MSNMQYGRSVSGKSTSLNVNLSGTRIASYNPQSSRSSSGSGSTFTSTTSTLDLSAFLTDNIDETIAKERIKNSKHYDSYQSGWDKVQDVIDKVGATCVVAYTSVVSGFIDVGEAVLDGSVWLTSKVVGLVSDDAETAMKEFIAKDLVSEANEWFYEQTDVGRAINDASALKYDSELAQGVRSVAEDVTVFVAATALSVVTCGAATPLVVMGVGALYGMGAAAQDTYAAHGTDTTTWQELMILGNGALSALSWYTSGKLGKGFIELGKSMAEAGVKEILAEMCRGIFSKETLKELFKPGNIVGNAIGTLMQTGGDIGLIATKLYNGGEVTPEEWALLIGELIVYFGLNTAEDVLSDNIISYGNPKIDIDTTKTPDAPYAPKTPDTPDTPNAPEILAETGLEDAVPKQPSADTPPQKQIETLDETEIIPEAKTPHPDDPYIDKALDILDPNTATKLSDEIGNLDEDGLQKVLSAMTGAEIAAQLKDLDAKDMDRVLNALSGDQLTDVVGEIAERISKGELPPDILDKLDPSIKLEVLERTDPNILIKSKSPWYKDWQVRKGMADFEAEYPGYTIDDIRTDQEFRDELLDQFTINGSSETAVLGKYKPTDGTSFGYTELALDPNYNSTYFEYGNRAAALEGGLGGDDVYELLNRPYLESIIEEARSGTKRIILTTGPDSCDWKTGFYGKELENIADILGLDSADSLANCLKKVEVIVNGAKGFVYEIDFGMIP